MSDRVHWRTINRLKNEFFEDSRGLQVPGTKRQSLFRFSGIEIVFVLYLIGVLDWVPEQFFTAYGDLRSHMAKCSENLGTRRWLGEMRSFFALMIQGQKQKIGGVHNESFSICIRVE